MHPIWKLQGKAKLTFEIIKLSLAGGGGYSQLTILTTFSNLQTVPTTLSRVVLEYIFFKQICTKAIFGIVHLAPILFNNKCLTNTIQPHVLVLKLFSTRMKFLSYYIKLKTGEHKNNSIFRPGYH